MIISHRKTKIFKDLQAIRAIAYIFFQLLCCFFAPVLFAHSIPINIGEGYGRKRSPDDFKRFLVIALGSCDEVSVLLDLVHDLKYLGEEFYAKWKAEYTEIGKGINKLIQVWR